MSKSRAFIKATVLAAALSSIGLAAHAADTIKVGILHSLPGTMAISETALKETALMTIEGERDDMLERLRQIEPQRPHKPAAGSNSRRGPRSLLLALLPVP